MSTFSVIMEVLSAGLSIWANADKNKYANQLRSLKEQYYAEFNKPDSDRSDAVLDNLEFQLRVLASSFASVVGAQNTSNKP